MVAYRNSPSLFRTVPRYQSEQKPIKKFGKSSRERSQGLPKLFWASIHRAHCAVIFAIAQLSCLSFSSLDTLANACKHLSSFVACKNEKLYLACPVCKITSVCRKLVPPRYRPLRNRKSSYRVSFLDFYLHLFSFFFYSC